MALEARYRMALVCLRGGDYSSAADIFLSRQLFDSPDRYNESRHLLARDYLNKKIMRQHAAICELQLFRQRREYNETRYLLAGTPRGKRRLYGRRGLYFSLGDYSDSRISITERGICCKTTQKTAL